MKMVEKDQVDIYIIEIHWLLKTDHQFEKNRHFKTLLGLFSL